ncbi:MAG: FAD-dependent oxidoreductase [Clostridiaceae bacterium]|mgnify:FL=1|nr:FAD-dependent oxidoreductase [Clostridiaceae bacterium]
MKKYDYLVIGTGAANITTDAAIDAGKTVAIIEKGKFGGTCLNRGCIPTKTLVNPVDYKIDFDRLKSKGLIEGEFKLNWTAMSERMWNHLNYQSSRVLEAYHAEENVDVYQGTGFFTGEKIIRVQLNDGTLSEELTADTILIANGARTRIPDNIKGLENVDYITSETFFGEKFPKQPYKSLVILGGGPIATEFAHIFAHLGTQVTIVQHNPRLLPIFDSDITEVVLKEYKEAGIEVYLNSEMIQVEVKDGVKKFTIEHRATGEINIIEATDLLLATGLTSNSDTLQISKTCIELDHRGWIKTNEFLETSVEGVYAIGDANGKFQLRHVANYEAEILAFNLFERERNDSGEAITPRRRARYDVVPSAVYTHPQVASVGLSTKMAEDQGYQIITGKYAYEYTIKPFAMGYDFGKPENFVKVIADQKTKQILGVQIVGPEAAILIQPYINLINAGEHKFKILEPDIGSAETARERKEFTARYLDPRTPDAVNYTMTIHPALSEVSTWASGQIEFGGPILNAEQPIDVD